LARFGQVDPSPPNDLIAAGQGLFVAGLAWDSMELWLLDGEVES
jgi:hypothetical protein